MQTKTKTMATISLALNLAVVAMEVAGVTMSAQDHGFGLFEFYTEDSNIFALIACAICVFYTYRYIKNGTDIPLWASIIKFVATCCLTVTFVVVICVLAPTAGVGGFSMMLFHRSMLFHHLLCPIVVFVSFVLCEPKPNFKKSVTAFALIPTVIYAVVSATLNILKVIDGPYPFLRVYNQPVFMSVIWFFVIVGGAYGLAWIVYLLNKKLAK